MVTMTQGAQAPWSLAQLYFGRDDAEHDMADGLLRAGFLRTVAFDEASNGRKSLIIGRKGSGKSAICMRLLAERASSTGAYLITPDDAAGEELRRFELQGVTDQTAKSLVWRYVFLIQTARHLVAHAKGAHGRKTPASLRSLRAFLLGNRELEEERLYERLLNGASGLRGSISLEAFGAKAALELKGLSEGARASRQLEIVEREVATTARDLECSQRHAPMLLLVDQLEQVWSNDPDSDAMVIGLLLAAKHVASTLPGITRCVLFLRADIYDVLHFGDGDKFHGDEIRIDWDEDQLAELALVRARAALGPQLTVDDFWAGLLPREVDQTPSRDYLLSRVLPRPRDVIQLLNAIRDTAYERAHQTITPADVVAATLRFSQWKLQDLAKEYLVNYPFLDRLLLMFQNNGYLVTRATVRKNFDPLQSVLQHQFPGYSNLLAPDNVVDILYGVGFLGVKRSGRVEYSGGHNVSVQPYENVFEIHPCFRAALNAADETKLDGLNIDVGRVQATNIAGRGIQVNAFSFEGQTVGRVGREGALLNSLLRSCDRMLARLGRIDLPSGARQQILEQITALAQKTSNVIRLMEGSDESWLAQEHGYRAADYLDNLGRQLAASGLSEAGDVEAVTRMLTEEVRRLRADLQGSLPYA
jgi:hypothetical protein